MKKLMILGQKTVSARWVVNQKHKNKDVTQKARLVARGFEEENLDEIGKESPTCCKEIAKCAQTQLWFT